MSTAQATASLAPPASAWAVRRRQIGSVIRLELKKGFFGRRSFWLYLVASTPIAAFLLRWALFGLNNGDPNDVEGAHKFMAFVYQVFLLRVVLFFSCVGIFGNLIRREILDRSLHYYFLSPLRRDLLVVAKYLTGFIVSSTVFCATTVACFVLNYMPHSSHTVRQFLFHGPGLSHLGHYLLVTVLACAGYGAVFVAFGFFFKSPIVPALAMFGWEWINFLLPPLLKKASVIYYLAGLCPVELPPVPFAFVAEAPPAWLSIVGILGLAAVLVYVSTFKVRHMEISYEES